MEEIVQDSQKEGDLLRQEILRAIYDFYQEFISGYPVACQKGCSTCCTTSVCATSFEAEFLLKGAVSLGEEGAGLLAMADRARKAEHFQPSCTINTSADICLKGHSPPEEVSALSFDPCPFLSARGECSLYSWRPFACRAMVSRKRCVAGGEADMPPFLITVNLAMCQVLEHLDRDGYYGNILDLLPVVSGKMDVSSFQGAVKTNRSLSCFVVPPDEAARFKSFMRRLSSVTVEKSGSQVKVGDLLPEEWTLLN